MHPADHHPTSRTLKTPTLAQRWLDVDIPTATHPTMRRRWANVALSIITQLREQSKCICCPKVGSTLIFRPCPILPCVDFGSALPGRPSPDVAHTQMHICWLNVEIPTMTNPTMMHRRWAKVAWLTITRRRAHSKCQR